MATHEHKWDEIRNLDTTLRPVESLSGFPWDTEPRLISEIQGMALHESLTRAWHILAEVKVLLEKGTPADVILEIVALLEIDTKERGNRNG